MKKAREKVTDMDPEAILDELTRLSIQQRSQDNDDINGERTNDDLDSYVREFKIDDSISKSFASHINLENIDTTKSSGSVSENTNIAKPAKKSKGLNVGGLFKRKTKVKTEANSNVLLECDHSEDKESKDIIKDDENIYCDMQSVLPPPPPRNAQQDDDVKYLKAGNALLEELLTDDDQCDYVLPTIYEPIDKIMIMMRKRNYKSLRDGIISQTDSNLVQRKTRNNLLHLCVQEKLADGVSFLLSLTQEMLLEENSDGLTPVQLAIKNGEVLCLKEMIKYIVEDSMLHQSLIRIAVESNQVHCLTALLESGQVTEEVLKDRSEDSPILVAVRCGHLTCLQMLIEFGFLFYGIDAGGRSPVEVARENGHLDCYNYLVVVEIVHQLIDIYIKRSRDYTRAIQELSCLEKCLEEIKLCLDVKDITDETTDRLNHLDVMRRELSTVLVDVHDTDNAHSKIRECLGMLMDVVEKLRDQAIRVEDIWSHQNKLRRLLNLKQTNETCQGRTCEVLNVPKNIRSNVTRKLINCVKNKQKMKYFEDILGESSVDYDKVVDSGSQQKHINRHGYQVSDGVHGDFNEPVYENHTICKSVYHPDNSSSASPRSLIYDIFSETDSNISANSLSTLTENGSKSSESESSLELGSVSESLSLSGCTLSYHRESSYPSDDGGITTVSAKLNIENEDLEHDNLREERLENHLRAIRKLSADQGDFIETVVTADGLRLENSTKANRSKEHINLPINHPFACAETSSTTQHNKPTNKHRLKWPLRFFRLNSASTKKLTKSSFIEGYERKPLMQSYQKNEDGNTNSWYEVSDEEASLAPVNSDAGSDISSRFVC